MKPSGRIALGFTRYSGQPKEGVAEQLAEQLAAAGFTQAQLVETNEWFCVLATKPDAG